MWSWKTQNTGLKFQRSWATLDSVISTVIFKELMLKSAGTTGRIHLHLGRRTNRPGFRSIAASEVRRRAGWALWSHFPASDTLLSAGSTLFLLDRWRLGPLAPDGRVDDDHAPRGWRQIQLAIILTDWKQRNLNSILNIKISRSKLRFKIAELYNG